MSRFTTNFLLHAVAIVAFCTSSLHVFSQTREERKHLSEANGAYRSGEYSKADSLYAIESATSTSQGKAISSFNRGNSAFRQERLDEAVEHFRSAERNTENPLEKSEALYNLGNAYYLQNKAKEAYDSYKQALRLNPNDDDARHNLMMAKALLSEEDQDGDQKDDGDNNDEEGDNNEDGDQDKSQDGDQDNTEGGDQNDDGDEDGDNKNEGDNDQEPQQENPRDQKPAQPGQISKADADRMLDALNQRERQLMQDLMKKKEDGKSRKVEKDW